MTNATDLPIEQPLHEQLAETLRIVTPAANVMTDENRSVIVTLSAPVGADRAVVVLIAAPTLFGHEISLTTAGETIETLDARFQFAGLDDHEVVMTVVSAWALLVERLDAAQRLARAQQ